MRLHLELQAERNRAAGLDVSEAGYAAQRQFGNLGVIQQQAREGRRGVWLEQFMQDARYAFRQLARSPGFTLVVMATLALGIGATTAIFSVVNTVILNPVGGADPERMVQISQRQVAQGKEHFQGVSPPVLDALYAHRDQFSDLAWSDNCRLERKTDDFVKIEHGAAVSPNYFSVLDVRPLWGRDFLPEEAVRFDPVDGLPSADAAIILSYAWWQSTWGGDRQLLGRTIEMGGRHFTVIGVMPPAVCFPQSTTQYWIGAQPRGVPAQGVRMAVTQIVARLTPETTLPQMQVRLDTLAQELMDENPAGSPYGGYWRLKPQGLEIRVRPLTAAFQGEGNWTQLRQTLLGLLAAIGFVLLIVCANVANLTLARVERRQHELAIRMATGASGGRLMRQLLTENLILALMGGAAGLGVAAWGLKMLVALNAMPRLRPVEIDGPLLGIALAVSTATGLAFGLAPMWRSGRIRVNALLADGGMNATGGRKRSLFRGALVIAQIAVTVVLLTSAGLMLRSVNRLLRVDPGFDPQNLLLVDVNLPWRKYDSPKEGPGLKNLLLAQLQERFSALPGVKAVGYQQKLFWQTFQVEGRTEPVVALQSQIGVGTSDVFQALRAPLLGGRYFIPEDAAQKSRVVINEAMARQFWPNETAIGKKLAPSRQGAASYEVIGVMGDFRIDSYLQEDGPVIYYPLQAKWTDARIIGGTPPQFVIRTDRDPEMIIPFVRRELKAAEPALLTPRFRVAKQVLFDSTLAQRTYRNYLVAFAGLGLLLSALGIYGVLAYAVARRTREIGIRLAIGAEARQVCALIVGQGASLIVAGMVSGLLASWALTRFLQNQLFDVSPTDPAVLAAVVVVLSAVGLFACWLPARRAAKVDPMVALRTD